MHEAIQSVPMNERKAWARAHFRGVENLLLPSFGPDLATLDEAGLRRDVRQTIAQGFFATVYADQGHDLATSLRALEVICDEAAGRLLVGILCFWPTLEENIAYARAAEAIGCTHALILYPAQLRPSSLDEVETYYRALIASCGLNMLLYASPLAALTQFDASGVPLDLYDKLAGLPNVVGIKLTQAIDVVLARQVCARFTGRLAVDCVPLDLLAVLGREFDLHWSGEWVAEACQGPDQRYVVDYVAHISRKEFAAAEQLYWTFHPLYQAICDVQIPKLKIGGHPWLHIKYFQWLTGGNGGVISIRNQTPEQVGTLTAADRLAMRARFVEANIVVTADADAAFITGAENARKGVHAGAYRDRPYYAD